MAQTIWIHKLADAKKAEADGMYYICQHLFQGLTQTGKLSNAKGWNTFEDASAKDGSSDMVPSKMSTHSKGRPPATAAKGIKKKEWRSRWDVERSSSVQQSRVTESEFR
jgi:hypothetical protein